MSTSDINTTAQADVASRIDALERKLDIVLEEVLLQQRQRRERDDLKDDLMIVGRDLYQTAVVELDAIHDSFRTVDLLHLGKKLLRNVDVITRSIEKLESLKDFLEDAGPLARDAFSSLMQELDALDRKGYFAFLRETRQALDAVVTSYSTEEVRRFGANLVVLLDTIRSLTQPDILEAINRAAVSFRSMDQFPEDPSLMSLVRQFRTPEARRGMAVLLAMVRSLGASGAAADPSHSTTSTHNQRDRA